MNFPPLNVIGKPDAPPAKSLIIRATFVGSLPPLGLVQSTVLSILCPVGKERGTPEPREFPSPQSSAHSPHGLTHVTAADLLAS